jgi:hypothetical protein
MTHLDDDDAVFEEEDLLTLLFFFFFFPEKEEDDDKGEETLKRWCAVDAVMFLFQFCGARVSVLFYPSSRFLCLGCQIVFYG